MKVIKKILPGADGSKRFQEKYGEKLVCVRYRIDPDQKLRYTTIEIIVDQGRYNPISPEFTQLFPRNVRIVKVKISYLETNLRRELIKHGGIWNNETKLWQIPQNIAKKLGLENRIQKE